MSRTFLLTDEFPPVQTGVARMMGEIASRYPRGELLVSTGQHRDAQDGDARFAGTTIDRLPLPTRILKSLPGLLFWSRRVATLARHHKPRFAWCDSLRPCAYPAKWVHERVGVKYGVLVHGAASALLEMIGAIERLRAVILGEDELKAGSISIKDLRVGMQARAGVQNHGEYKKSGKVGQVTVLRSDLVKTVQQMIG